MTDLRTTWHERTKSVTHGVTAFGVMQTTTGSTGAREIRTDCGVELTSIDMREQGPVTCVLCLESEWLVALLEHFETERPMSVPETAPATG